MASNKVSPSGKSEVGGVDKEVSNAGERLADEQAAPPASILQVFISNVCPACSKPKKLNTAFCKACYFGLSRQMKSALWNRFGEGFEEAYTAALSFLRCG